MNWQGEWTYLINLVSDKVIMQGLASKIQTIKDRMDSLNQVMMEISQKLYQTNEPQQQESQSNVEDAEFEEV